MRRLIEPSHLDLYCLQRSIIIACGSERITALFFFFFLLRQSVTLQSYCNILDPKSSRNSSLLCDILILVLTDNCSLFIVFEKISSALSTFTGCF